MKKPSIKIIGLIAFIAFIILFGTIFIPKPKIVNNKEEMKSVRAGYPIPFIEQDFSRYDPPFPWKYSFGSGGLYEDPVRILWSNFLLSYVIMFSITGATVLGIGQVIRPKK